VLFLFARSRPPCTVARWAPQTSELPPRLEQSVTAQRMPSEPIARRARQMCRWRDRVALLPLRSLGSSPIDFGRCRGNVKSREHSSERSDSIRSKSIGTIRHVSCPVSGHRWPAALPCDATPITGCAAGAARDRAGPGSAIAILRVCGRQSRHAACLAAGATSCRR